MDDFEKLKAKYKRIEVLCELCGHDKMLLFQEYGRTGKAGEYGYCPLKICARCGHKATNPRYEDGFFVEYYDSMYRAVAYAHMPDENYINAQINRSSGVRDYVMNELKIKAGRLLDHGCAQGYTMKPWIEAGWKCKGFDPHRPSVLQGKEAGFSVDLCSGEDMPYEDGSFDFILSLGSIEHVYDLHKTMMEMRRVLSTNGVTTLRWRLDKIFGSPLEYYNHNHSRFFTGNTVEIALRLYGFEPFHATEKQLEGWTSYRYDFARKQEKLPGEKERAAIIERWHDTPAAEIEKLKKIREDYYKRCKIFLDIYNNYGGDFEKIKATIEKTGLYWKFMAGAGDPLVRAKMEVDRYIREYDAGKVV